MENSNCRVLLIEDDKIDQMAFTRLVKEENLAYDCIVAGTVLEAKRILNDREFDVVITDYLLQDGTAFDILDLVKDTPIIFATGAGNEKLAVKAMKAGAYDYLIKNPSRSYLEILPLIIENAVNHAKMAKEVRKYHEHLEDLVKERTEQLEKTNQELNDVVYIMSHDLKTPLRGISTLADWLLNDYIEKFDLKGREQMKLLLSRVSRINNLIEGILQYSRIGRIKEEKIPVNLEELVPRIIDMISPSDNIKIIIENKLPVIQCERTKIIHVFKNLLSNAIRCMDKPQGQIRIGCIEDGDCWEFSITDNGTGIKEEYYEKIFGIFQTLSLRDESESTGVGLTVVKRVVESYGGRIWVVSKPGEGSTFFFTLRKTEVELKSNKHLQQSC